MQVIHYSFSAFYVAVTLDLFIKCNLIGKNCINKHVVKSRLIEKVYKKIYQRN